MTIVEFGKILKEINGSAVADDVYNDNLERIAKFLNSHSDNDSLLTLLDTVISHKADIMTVSANFVPVLVTILEYMCIISPDLMFIVDTIQGKTVLEIIQEVSVDNYTILDIPKLSDAVANVPIGTITARSAHVIVLLTRLGYLPSQRFSRKGELIMEYVKFRNLDRRIFHLENIVESMNKKLDEILATKSSS